MAGRRLANSLAEALYLRAGIDLTRPTSVQATINERCNYRCRYCGFWRRESFQGGYYYDEMSIEEWRAALLSLHDFVGRYLVRFVGGEPFLKPGFVDLLESCGGSGIDWSVCTNGAALSKRSVARRVVAARPFHIDLSLDSSERETNDHLRGVPGALQQVEQAIAHLVAEREASGWRFPIRLKPVVTRANFRQLPRLLDWAAERGVDSVDPSPVRPWTPEVPSELWIDQESELAELAEVVEELVRRKSLATCTTLETPVEKLRAFVPHFRGEVVRHGASPCRVGLREYLIRPDGEVKVCWFHAPIGNVKRAGAREIWRGALARERRAETVKCALFGSVNCAHSCLASKTLRQEARRGWTLLRSTGRGARPLPGRRAA